LTAYRADKPGNHYVDTIRLESKLTTKDSSTVQFSLVQGPNTWDFFCNNEAKKKDWLTALQDTIDTFALHLELDADILQVNTLDKDFTILSACFGVLINAKHRIDVTETLRNIVAQQGGSQLMLNAGPKEHLFGHPYSKKTVIKKHYQLQIVYAARGDIRVKKFEEKDPVLIHANV